MKRSLSDLLQRPAARSVRLIALDYLDQAAAALERLENPEDHEALHDFRVALRRLRTTLRAYRPLLDPSVPRRVRRRLRDTADATNSARDAEVALAWLRPLEAEFVPRDRIGLHWLIARIERGRTKDFPRVQAEAQRSFAAVSRRLRKGLEEYHRPVAVRGKAAAPEQRFGPIAAQTLIDQAKHLDAALAAVVAQDEETIHRARIEAKRLRYVLEPLGVRLRGGSELVQRLKALQDLLGELHDLLALEDDVRTALEAAAVARAGRLWKLTLEPHPEAPALRAAQRRRQNPGLFAVAQRSRDRRGTLFGQLAVGWLGRPEAWARDVLAAVAPLTAPARRARRPVSA